MKKLLNYFYKVYNYYKTNSLYSNIKNKQSRDKFNFIYKSNYWKSNIEGSRSGRGSDLDSTLEIRRDLKEFISEYDIKSILDIPCGDFYWMRSINLEKINYYGADIVEELIESNKKNFNKQNIKFDVKDIVNDDLPTVDLIFSRDCYVHLSDKEITQSLQNVINSKSKFFATTIFLENFDNKTSNFADNWRPLNITKHPFNVKDPEIILNDSNLSQSNKRIGIWRIDTL
jgi:2-polyprenyl-3-methyl-5-hydroxy-6-metoxy-1,4-benzoquinol methylase|tara:strand:- start:365 stop:1051 length:687 start_codon:yes stop_codon:yes gene_type:complete